MKQRGQDTMKCPYCAHPSQQRVQRGSYEGRGKRHPEKL